MLRSEPTSRWGDVEVRDELARQERLMAPYKSHRSLLQAVYDYLQMSFDEVVMGHLSQYQLNQRALLLRETLARHQARVEQITGLPTPPVAPTPETDL